MIIFLAPAYINFVIGHTCGLDIFCPKDFRNSYTLISYTDSMEYQEQMVELILENLECRGSLRIKKCHKKWNRFTIFLTPPLPQDVLDFFEFGKNRKFDGPPPLYPL